MTDAAGAAPARVEARSKRRVRSQFLRAYLQAPSAIFGLVILVMLAFFAAFGPLLFGDAATETDALHGRANPSWDHLLGTDDLGRDILARMIVATRLSLGIGLGAAAIAFGLGTLLGSSAALVRPRLRTPMLRFVDTMISFPGLLTAILIGVMIGVGAKSVILGIGIAGCFAYARTTSTLALSVAGREYINAARVVGVRGRRLLLRYVLPNIAEPLIIFLGITISFAVLAAAGLSFLGLGVQPPEVDWGRMLTEGVKNIYVTPVAAVGPAVMIALTALAFGYTGEAVARATNPRLWTEGRRPKPAPPAEDHAAATAAAASVAAAPAASSDGQLLSVRDLSVTFPSANGPIEVVKGVSFSIGKGEVIGIVGESGSGKTMTALAIAQLAPYPGEVTGAVELSGANLAGLPRKRLDRVLGTDVAVVFQDPMSSLNPALTVGEQLTEGPRIHRGLTRKAARQLAVSRLVEVHIPAAERQLKRYPHEFSGGMRQRAMIAMGLMNEPSLLICDEPTTALDVTIQAQIMDLLNEVNESHGTAIVLISHNLALVSQNCHRVLVMYAGRIVEELDADQLTSDAKHPYTRALLGAVPEVGRPRGEPLAYIPGETPDIGSPPPGCPYHPRCPVAVERCLTVRPELIVRPQERHRRVACHVANA